jgi:hypothetical protein
VLWRAGCPPLFGIEKEETAATPAQNAACAEANAQLERAFTTLDSADRILLVGRWTYYAEGSGTGLDAHNLIEMQRAAGADYEAETQAALFAEALSATVDRLSDSFASVHIARQVAEVPNYDSRDVARGLAHGKLEPIDVSAISTVSEETLAARVANAERPIYALQSEGRIALIDTWKELCPERCSILISGKPVYFDNNHLTNAGALAIRSLFLPFLRGSET